MWGNQTNCNHEKRSVHSARSEHAELIGGDEPHRERRNGGLWHLLGIDGVPTHARRIHRQDGGAEIAGQTAEDTAAQAASDYAELRAVLCNRHHICIA